jgi:hypothetical protein
LFQLIPCLCVCVCVCVCARCVCVCCVRVFVRVVIVVVAGGDHRSPATETDEHCGCKQTTHDGNSSTRVPRARKRATSTSARHVRSPTTICKQQRDCKNCSLRRLLASPVRLKFMLSTMFYVCRSLVHRARPPQTVTLCLHAMLTLACLFTNTHDPRYPPPGTPSWKHDTYGRGVSFKCCGGDIASVFSTFREHRPLFTS